MTDHDLDRDISRVREIAARLPHNQPFATSGSGFKLWQKRRANLLKRAVAKITKFTAPLDELRLAAHEISEQIGDVFPACAVDLPRGYRLVSNRNGERGMARNAVMFSPSFAEPLPSKQDIEQLAFDFRTGLLAEIEANFSGNSNTLKNKAEGTR